MVEIYEHEFERFKVHEEQLRILKNCILDDEILKMDLIRIVKAMEKKEEQTNE